ncbi:BZ3500_MvSof-1268-A1-R1_Chr3-1g05982 [Microbotryum saponariae]|uniref:BZ3500_MvSof-1268-A1-R1_Chr3-1g05982 protein n=1 Tax=Microbotryum saponariae TaxID=289078 RepID=A0A2X0NC75_9BASI|nr:BZ3500_MvSof-1268-A1-R1_Chr3-1g05982 [Microbotryum saponariae]SDA05172.1 BZ3501_MvSof-1269-A2-R1_Chr3-1g05652 [Microbotryum saponariae]
MRSVLALVAIALAVASPIAAAAHPHPAEHKHEHPHQRTPAKVDHHHGQHKRITKVVKKSGHLKDEDIKIVNFLLTLEFMEANFFSQGVKNFTKEDFKHVPTLFERFQDIATQESDHVATLKQVLGHNAVSPCEYDFGESLHSVESFLATSRALETVGTSAYLGATPHLSTSELIGTSGSILTIEARHSSLLNEYEAETGFPTAFETALNFNQSWTLAYKMIKPNTCGPKKPLPDGLAPFPELTIVTPKAVKGKKHAKESGLLLQLPDLAVPNVAKAPKGKIAPGTSLHGKLYAAFLNNGETFYAPIEFVHGATLANVQPPKGLKGATYIIVTKSADSLSNENTVAGPTIKFF